MINKLGIVGNINNLNEKLIQQQNKMIRESVKQEEEIIRVEQEATDSYLNNVEVQQTLTDLELKILGG